MNHTPGMSNQWKKPINNNEIWFKKVSEKIVPREPTRIGRRTVVTGLFRFDEKIYFFRYILQTLQC